MVALLIAGMVLSSMATQSLRLVEAAQRRQLEVQLRWGIASAERAMLPAAREILGDLQDAHEERWRQIGRRSQEAKPAPAALEEILVLGEFRFHVRLADEDAKVNLNTIYHYRGESDVERYLREVQPSLSRAPVRLLPDVPSLRIVAEAEPEERDEERPLAFGSWGQIFDFGGWPAASTAAWLSHFSHQTSCWGSGSLNITRATDDAINRVGSLATSRGTASDLIAAHREHPERSVGQLLDEVGVDESERLLLEDLLTKQSSCYSLWIKASSRTQRSERFAITEQLEDGRSRPQSFAF